MVTNWDNIWMGPWTYSYPIVLTNWVGFVYEIKELDTGLKYIGIKKFWKVIKRPPLKGKKNKRHGKVQSDWKTYNSSNKKLAAKIEANPENYEKRILRLCETITDMKLFEAYIQLDYYFKGEWDMLYNQMINVRCRVRKEKELK